MSNQIQNKLRANDAAALKRLGQNFLVSQSVLEKMLKSAELEAKDTVLEIGPGLGALTLELSKRSKRVVAVEKDRKISEILKQILSEKGKGNTEVVNRDFLDAGFEIKDLKLEQDYKVVANLPFNVGSAIIMKLLESSRPPEIMSVMMQKEVAQRMCAKAPRMNKLAIFCQVLSKPSIESFVPPSAFWPKPKVNSAIVKIVPKKKNLSFSFESFGKVVNAGFRHPRKTLLNNFLNIQDKMIPENKEEITQWLAQNNIRADQRPQTLSVENWIALARKTR